MITLADQLACARRVLAMRTALSDDERRETADELACMAAIIETIEKAMLAEPIMTDVSKIGWKPD